MIIKKPIFWIILILVIGILATFIVIGLMTSLGVYQGIAISIAVFSIMVSTFFASRSLSLANESLKLTRNKVRPFIYVQSGDRKILISPTEIILTFEFVNAGILPGEMIDVETQFFVENEDITIENHSSYFPPSSSIPSQPILFPNLKYNIKHTIDLNEEFGRMIWDTIHSGKSKVRFRTRYKDKDNEYTTIQTEQLSENTNNMLERRPIFPQYWT